MRPARLLMAWLLLVGSLSVAADRQDRPSPTDGDGDPLPRGAVARLGTTRWRLPYEPRGFVLSPDGRTLAVTTNYFTTELVDAGSGKYLRSLGPAAFLGDNDEIRNPVAFSADSKTIAHLDAEGQNAVLKIRRLDGERERSIPFPTKGRSKPKPPPEVKKEKNWGTTQFEYFSALALSPDGKFIAAAERYYFICYGGNKDRIYLEKDENTVRLWETSSGKELFSLTGHTKVINSLFFSPDGKRLTSASEDGTVRFWDTSTGKEKRPYWKADGPLFCAVYSPDGKWFAAGSKQSVLLWNAATGTLRHRLALPAKEVRSLVFAPDSKLLAAGGETALRLWDAGTADRLRETLDLPHALASISFSADGKTLLLGYAGKQIIERRDAVTLKSRGEGNGHTTLVGALAFTADNQQILTSTSAYDFHRWDTRTGKLCSRSGKDQKLLKRIWLASQGRNAPLLTEESVAVGFRTAVPGRPSPLEAMAGFHNCSSDGKRILIEQQKDEGSTLIVRDTESDKSVREFPQTEKDVHASLSPDGRTLAVAASNRLTLLDVDSGRQRQYVFAREKSEPRFVGGWAKFSPDSSRIVFLDGVGKARIMTARDGRLLRTIAFKDEDRITGMAFSADGKTLCVCAFNKPQSLWEVASGQQIRSYVGWSALFSPDNRLLAIQNENALSLHDLYSGKTFRNCKDAVGCAGNITFSPDGKRLASACLDTTVLLWDTTTPETAETVSPLDEKTLEQLWKILEKGEASTAYSAMGRLIADPQPTLSFLRKCLRRIPPVEEKRLRQWIADLDSDSFSKRETASSELRRLGPLVESAMRKALAGQGSPETRRRLTDLLYSLQAGETRLPGDELAHVRAIQVLERIGTAEARQLLEHLAEGAETMPRTRDAQEALLRLRKSSGGR